MTIFRNDLKKGEKNEHNYQTKLVGYAKCANNGINEQLSI